MYLKIFRKTNLINLPPLTTIMPTNLKNKLDSVKAQIDELEKE